MILFKFTSSLTFIGWLYNIVEYQREPYERRGSAHYAYAVYPPGTTQTNFLVQGLIIRDDPAAVGDYIANYTCKRYE